MNPRPFSATLLAAVLAACTPQPKVDEAAVFGVIEENLQAMQAEDIDGVMATVHPEGADVAATRAVVEEIFAKYDFKYRLSGLKVVSVKDGEVQVRFVQTTERTGGAEDQADNVLDGVHTLKKDGAKWKLLRTTATRVTPLKP